MSWGVREIWAPFVMNTERIEFSTYRISPFNVIRGEKKHSGSESWMLDEDGNVEEFALKSDAEKWAMIYQKHALLNGVTYKAMRIRKRLRLVWGIVP